MVQKDLRRRAEGAAGNRKVISICNKTADSFMPRLGNLLFLLLSIINRLHLYSFLNCNKKLHTF